MKYGNPDDGHIPNFLREAADHHGAVLQQAVTLFASHPYDLKKVLVVGTGQIQDSFQVSHQH